MLNVPETSRRGFPEFLAGVRGKETVASTMGSIAYFLEAKRFADERIEPGVEITLLLVREDRGGNGHQLRAAPPKLRKEFLDHFRPFEVRHPNVHEHEVGQTGAQFLQRLQAAFG